MSEPQAAATGTPEPEAGPDQRHGGAVKPATEPRKKSVPKAGRSGAAGAIAVIALIGAVGALGGAYYLWQELQASRAAQTAAETATAERLSQLRSALEDTIRRQGESAMATVADADARVDARVTALAQAVEHLRRAIGRDGDAWVTAEVRHLLRIANARLQLAGDVAAAVVALDTADQRLAALGDPAYTPVREVLARELHALRGTGEADLAGIAHKLTGLIDAVERLPMAGPYTGDQPPAAPAPAAETPREITGWRDFLTALWTDIRGLVTIRRADQGTEPALLPPAERLHLRQNLRLKLETARLSLLNRQGEVYHAALAEASTWLQTYFAADTPPVAEALATVSALAKVPVEPALPDISGSLRILDRIEQRLRESGAQPEPAP